MKWTTQTRLSDFTSSEEDTPTESNPDDPKTTDVPIQTGTPCLAHKSAHLWHRTINEDEEWGVCEINDTVILVRLINDRIHAYGEEAVCKWCGGILEIRDDKIFCIGTCRRYQGEFSRDLDDFLRWDGVKSYTVRKTVAEMEHLELEPRDYESLSYVPDWSALYEYEDEPEDEGLSKE